LHVLADHVAIQVRDDRSGLSRHGLQDQRLGSAIDPPVAECFPADVREKRFAAAARPQLLDVVGAETVQEPHPIRACDLHLGAPADVDQPGVRGERFVFGQQFGR
jgi:hypothetical protein